MTYCWLKELSLPALVVQIHHGCNYWRMMFLIATTFSGTEAWPRGTLRQNMSIISTVRVSEYMCACLYVFEPYCNLDNCRRDDCM